MLHPSFSVYLKRLSQAWIHARLISILKTRKDPAVPKSYQLLRLLDTFGKLFKRILLTRILREVSWHRPVRHVQFGYRPKHSTALWINRHVERVSRNFEGKRLTGAGFLYVAKALKLYG